MIIPKARQLQSGNWTIQLRINGKSVTGTFASEIEAKEWATSYKETHKGRLAKNIVSDSDYNRLLRGIAEENVEEARKSIKQLPILATELEMVDTMDGLTFEKYCARLFILSGFFIGSRIYLTKGAGDYGADIIIECLDKRRVSIQCKRVKGNVGIKAIQEVVASKKHYRTTESAVITNSHFTPAARQLAHENGVALLDRKYLIRMIKLYIEAISSMYRKSQWEDFLNEMEMQPKKRRKNCNKTNSL